MAKPGMGEKGGVQKPGKPDDTLSEADLASDIMGNNQLQGDDQANVHNERQAMPDAKLEPDSGPVESFSLLDKDKRARHELGKGNRHAGQPSDHDSAEGEG